MEGFIDTDIWVPIHTLPGFECCIEYYINSSGDVKSTKGVNERILKHKPHKMGYPTVNLTQRLSKGKILTVCVHKLVAFAFLPPPLLPYGQKKGCCCIDHIDEDKKNCHVSNLRWLSIQQNNSKANYKRRPKNTPEQQEAAKERHRVCNREHMRRKRAKDKEAKIEESDN